MTTTIPPDISSRPLSMTAEHRVQARAATVYEAWTERFDRWFAEPGERIMAPEDGATLVTLTHSGFRTEPAWKGHRDNWPEGLAERGAQRPRIVPPTAGSAVRTPPPPPAGRG